MKIWDKELNAWYDRRVKTVEEQASELKGKNEEILESTGRNKGFPGGSDGKEPACNVGDPGSVPGSGRSSGEGNGYPLQYYWLGNFMDRGAWWATVPGVTESQLWLSY